MEILWTFSIYLESVAILPQLFMVSKTGEAESITSHYLFALGSYRALYILNWIYRWADFYIKMAFLGTKNNFLFYGIIILTLNSRSILKKDSKEESEVTQNRKLSYSLAQ